ncbi:MAG TPA: hypothetical protein VFK05_35760 [Polyangiaceae bacterium]|nr:hypothetical protein [Polyangiaceae bacterium]
MSAVAYRFLLAVACLGGAFSACKDKPAAQLAPTASALQAAPAPAAALEFTVDSASSKVSFLMDSPLEKIDGDASGGLSGSLFVDLTDLGKSTALVKVDLQKLVLYQQKRGDEKTTYSERKKSDLQNEHARNWLQIVPRPGDVSPEQAEANRWVEFKVDKLEAVSVPNVAAATGNERKLSAIATGEFRLHGRKQPKSVKLELSIEYQGDQLRSLHVKTSEPLDVGLEEFEVNPRDDAGKFVKTLTEALSSNLKGKVAQRAPVMLDFVARAP